MLEFKERWRPAGIRNDTLPAGRRAKGSNSAASRPMPPRWRRSLSLPAKHFP
jgi:hypothetical protein